MPRRPLLSPRGLSKRVKGSRFFKFIQRLRKSRTQEEPHGPGSDTVIERPLELVDKTGVQPELLQDPDVGASEVFVGDHSKDGGADDGLDSIVIPTVTTDGCVVTRNQGEVALNLQSQVYRDRSDSLHDLANTLSDRFDQHGDLNDLDRCIEYHHQALDLRPYGHPDQSTSLTNLAAALNDRFEQRRDPKDLDRCIAHHKQALDLRPKGPLRSLSLCNLANALNTRFGLCGDLNDLDRCIEYNHQALDLLPDGHPARSLSLNTLADALRHRFHLRGDGRDLDHCIECHQQALKLRPDGHVLRSMSLINLALALRNRFSQCGVEKDLNDCIEYNSQALDLCSKTHPIRFLALSNLANALNHRFSQLLDVNDLDRCVDHHEEALELRPDGHALRSASLNNLAKALNTRFGHRGELKDLDRCIGYYHQALTLCPDGHPDRSTSLSNFAAALTDRFRQRGDGKDLDHCIEYAHQALDLLPDSHPVWSLSLNNLANALRHRFHRFGDGKDLDHCIEYHQRVLKLQPDGHPDRSMFLSNLANALSTRFVQRGDLEDLDRCIEYNNQALVLRPDGHPDRTWSLNNLASALRNRVEMGGDGKDLDDCIKYNHQALHLCPNGHALRSLLLFNLALALGDRFSQRGDDKDLDECIEYNNQTLDLCPEGRSQRSSLLSSLANALGARFHRRRDGNDLDGSIEYHQQALELRPNGHPDRSMSLSNLAGALQDRFDQHGDPRDVYSCLLLYEQSARQLSCPISHRLEASLRWITVARAHRADCQLEAYTTALTLLDQYVITARTVSARHLRLAKELRNTRPLASDAASCALQQGQTERAVELLEQGRAILFTQLGQFHTAISDLYSVQPKLVDSFTDLSRQLEVSAVSNNPYLSSPNGRDDVGRFQGLSAQWHETVKQIREIPGFASFLQRPPFEALAEAAAVAPVIIVNVSEYRCDAIIVLSTRRPIVVPLPGATAHGIAELLEARDDALNRDRETEGTRADKPWYKVLRGLWKQIVAPIVQVLQRDIQLPKRSRICWCPTSNLWMLPLHAAGPYKQGQDNLSDMFVSSYTATLSALSQAVGHPISTPSSSSPRMLFIGQPEADGQPKLYFVDEELRRLRTFMSSVRVLDRNGCTNESVLAALGDHPWVHFSCHAEQDPSQPFSSRLILHHSHLRLLDIIKGRRTTSNAELAVLSACHSAAGDRTTPDEVLHLVAGMQFAGFRSVVGTMWDSDDSDAPDIAEAFYGYIMSKDRPSVDSRNAAEALAFAVDSLRKKKDVPFERWVNYVHFGL